MGNNNQGWSDEELAQINEQLQRIIQSGIFMRADRQIRFLKYIVKQTLDGTADKLNQFLIGIDVFDRDESFDPATDSLVRVEAGRLRSKLTEYYATEGQSDAIILTMPKGGYGVQVEQRETGEAFTPIAAKDPSSGQSLAIPAIIAGLALIVILFIVLMPGQESADSIPFNEPVIVDTSNTTPSIAVLPFDNMSDDPEQEYFSDGISEDIITDLSKLSGLLVIARHSSFAFKGQEKGIKEIGKELNVEYVLEGSVRKSGDQLRITAQLIDASTEQHLWAERYDRTLDEIFTIQDDVTRKIVDALKVTLTNQEETRLGHHGTENILAHDKYLRAQEQFYIYTEEGINNSIDLFTEAIDLDPGYAEAYAWKSRAIIFTFIIGMNNSITDTIDPALELANQAIILDPLLPMGHANRGWALRWNKQYDEALKSFNQATTLDPNFADSYLWRSMTLSVIERGDESMESIQQAITLNPYYGVTYIFARGLAALSRRKYEQAIEYFDRAIARNEYFTVSHIYKIFALQILGRNDEAEAARAILVEIFPDYEFSASHLYFYDEWASYLENTSQP